MQHFAFVAQCSWKDFNATCNALLLWHNTVENISWPMYCIMISYFFRNWSWKCFSDFYVCFHWHKYVPSLIKGLVGTGFNLNCCSIPLLVSQQEMLLYHWIWHCLRLLSWLMKAANLHVWMLNNHRLTGEIGIQKVCSSLYRAHCSISAQYLNSNFIYFWCRQDILEEKGVQCLELVATSCMTSVAALQLSLVTSCKPMIN